MVESYKTIKTKSEGYFKERNSKFIARAFPVEHEDEIKSCLKQLRKEFHDARHHCYAWKLGTDNNNYRINDDGEPSNSAGMPIYHKILSFELTNILIVVIRYFGGTKLGIPGLINAYKTAAHLSIENNKIIKKQIQRIYKIDYDYDKINNVMKIVNDLNCSVINQSFEIKCQIEIGVPVANQEIFESKLEILKDIKYQFIKTK